MKKVQILDIIPPILHRDVMSANLYENNFHILLYERYDKRGLLIGIDKLEAQNMVMTLQQLPHESKQIFTFIETLLKQTAWSMEGVYITGNLEGGPLETNIRIRQKKVTQTINCRPGDGFTLALQTGTPIYISNDMLDRFSFELPQKYWEQTSKQQGIKDLTKKIKENKQLYENEFMEMSQKAANKSLKAYAQSTEEVLCFIFEN